MFLELSAWPTLNFDGDPGSCPFDTKKQEKQASKLIGKEVKENKKNIEYTNKEEVRQLLLLYCMCIVNSLTVIRDMIESLRYRELSWLISFLTLAG